MGFEEEYKNIDKNRSFDWYDLMAAYKSGFKSGAKTSIVKELRKIYKHLNEGNIYEQ